MQNSLNKAIQALKEEGYTENDISTMVTDWGKAAFTRLYSEMMLSFPEDEMKKFEAMEKEEAQKLIKEEFRKKTGKDPDALAKEYLDIIASEFLAARAKDALTNQ